jgi:hypothetical protein
MCMYTSSSQAAAGLQRRRLRTPASQPAQRYRPGFFPSSAAHAAHGARCGAPPSPPVRPWRVLQVPTSDVVVGVVDLGLVSCVWFVVPARARVRPREEGQRNLRRGTGHGPTTTTSSPRTPHDAGGKRARALYPPPIALLDGVTSASNLKLPLTAGALIGRVVLDRVLTSPALPGSRAKRGSLSAHALLPSALCPGAWHNSR